MTDLDQPSAVDFLRVCSCRLLRREHREAEGIMSDHNTYAGFAALSICESLLLALNDASIIPENEIIGILRDAASTHERAGKTDVEPEMHKAVAALINKIIAGGNSVRHT